ncbi:Mesoderm development candidate 2 [Quillaja saponaria]|uniref:Mesoderm development candidate 2 n=1 Tax=Quillaja saponaria TaxID=32244 RepID=A0AAD7LSV5_QUISA|nr:Mesoderm development candidate 2 [Quillaja saponaria]
MKTVNTSLPSLFALLFFLILPLLISKNGEFGRFAEGTKRRVHITDDLDDVIDDEEDESWKEWGKKSTPSSDSDPPPSDLSKMDLSEIQAMMMKKQSGPVFGFVKLRLGVRRTPDMVAEIAMRWTHVLRTGAVGARFMGVDLGTIMFNMESGQDTEELREFVLSQPEAYEIKIGEQVYRRPGDPPLDEVVAELQSEKKKPDNAGLTEKNGNVKEEL